MPPLRATNDHDGEGAGLTVRTEVISRGIGGPRYTGGTICIQDGQGPGPAGAIAVQPCVAGITEKLKENAEGPAQVTGDQVSVRQHSLKEQIEADRYLRSAEAGTKKKLPIRFAKLTPKGTV